MSQMQVAGLQSQVLYTPSGAKLQLAALHTQVLRRLTPPNMQVANVYAQVLIANETLSAGDPMVTVQQNIPGLGWKPLVPRRAQ